MLIAALVAFGIGFVGSLPTTGPVAVGILALGVAGRAREALGVALGAALGEVAWAALAFAGVAAVFTRWPMAARIGSVVGGGAVVGIGVILAWRGLRELRTLPAVGAGSVAVGLLGVLTNLSLPLQWSAAVSAFAAWIPHVPYTTPAFGLGAGLGVFTGYATVLAVLRRRALAERTADRVVRGCGVWLVGLGLFLVARTWA